MTFLRVGTMLTHHLECRLLVKGLQSIHIFNIFFYLVPIMCQANMLSGGYRALNEGNEEEEMPTPGD